MRNEFATPIQMIICGSDRIPYQFGAKLSHKMERFLRMVVICLLIALKNNVKEKQTMKNSTDDDAHCCKSQQKQT